MVPTDSGWNCPQCGTAILDAPAKPKAQWREQPHETSAPARAGAVLRW